MYCSISSFQRGLHWCSEKLILPKPHIPMCSKWHRLDWSSTSPKLWLLKSILAASLDLCGQVQCEWYGQESSLLVTAPHVASTMGGGEGWFYLAVHFWESPPILPQWGNASFHLPLLPGPLPRDTRLLLCLFKYCLMVFPSSQVLLLQVWETYEAKRRLKELKGVRWSLGPKVPTLSLFYLSETSSVFSLKHPVFWLLHSRKNRERYVSFIILEAKVHIVPIFKILINRIFFRINIFERSMHSPTLK